MARIVHLQSDSQTDRLTGRYRIGESYGEVPTDGLTGDDDVDKLILLARAVVKEGEYIQPMFVGDWTSSHLYRCDGERRPPGRTRQHGEQQTSTRFDSEALHQPLPRFAEVSRPAQPGGERIESRGTKPMAGDLGGRMSRDTPVNRPEPTESTILAFHHHNKHFRSTHAFVGWATGVHGTQITTVWNAGDTTTSKGFGSNRPAPFMLRLTTTTLSVKSLDAGRNSPRRSATPNNQ